MNFWEAQRKARSKTSLYIAIFVALTILCAIAVEYALRYAVPEDYHPDYPLFGLGFASVTFAVALFQYSMFSSFGGGYVAESVGGYLLSRGEANPKEEQLLNIVEEVALAAALPAPAVYIIPAQQINAFAAGTNRQNAAIAITQGALIKLNRDEIQGVIAHEFGHIYNGDMKISLRLAAMVMGFFFICYLALRLLQFSSFRSDYSYYSEGEGNSGGGNGNGGDRRGGGNPVAIAALILIAAGALMWFFGSILKSCISRQREYLADACAVQFTRTPNGIVGALRKISKDSVNDMPYEGSAYSHLYLEDHSTFSSIFATHPPINRRIEAILGKEYMPDEWKDSV
jgi:heat shock protein HtpX